MLEVVVLLSFVFILGYLFHQCVRNGFFSDPVRQAVIQIAQYYSQRHADSIKQQSQEISQSAAPVLAEHFGNLPASDMIVISREFPERVLVELHRELHAMFSEKSIIRANGLEKDYHAVITMNDCLVPSQHRQVRLASFTFTEFDIGEEEPLQCVCNGLWLWKEQEHSIALLFGPSGMPHDPKGLRIDIAVPQNPTATAEAENIMKRLEQAVKSCPSYRHKVLSLEAPEYDYSGTHSKIKVHQIHPISREQLVLPDKTIELLERNVFGFVQRRHQLKKLGLQTKKGLLFYGPPGTGKTHTLHYLINRLKEEYTTLIITAEQVGLLGEYFILARLLEPAIVIIEDADIIARAREEQTVCTESLLNKLLNEMDGLKESADLLFLLTTNRPEVLEEALRNRPGRVDQAIEFPLPDEQGRAKLAKLYAGDLELTPELTKEIVARTEGASAAFVKELLRRSAQFLLERDAASQRLEKIDCEGAIDEMLHGSSFGVLNVGKR
ncbi:MAG: ATP-binding protein [Planctomycetaceae bacterium]|nr:ATP-binding protein [Planctomycetaceae bacterium]